MAEELLDAGVPQGAPEGASREHVQDGVDGAADEDHGPGDEGHGVPGALQVLRCGREVVFTGQDDEREDVYYVMRRPTDGEHDHHAGDENCGLALRLEGHLRDPAAQATVADHQDEEG